MDKDIEEILDQSERDFRSVTILPPKPITEEQYDMLKDSAFGEETEEERLEREKLMGKGKIGVEVPPLNVVEGDRLRGDFRELLPEEEFKSNTADW